MLAGFLKVEWALFDRYVKCWVVFPVSRSKRYKQTDIFNQVYWGLWRVVTMGLV